MGTEVSEDDVHNILNLCDQVIALSEYRGQVGAPLQGGRFLRGTGTVQAQRAVPRRTMPPDASSHCSHAWPVPCTHSLLTLGCPPRPCSCTTTSSLA